MCPDVFAQYCASDMVLMLDSNAVYLELLNVKSRITRHFYLSNHLSKAITLSLNSTIMVVCKALNNIASSSAEAEIAGVFTNAQLSIPVQCILDRFNHP